MNVLFALTLFTIVLGKFVPDSGIELGTMILPLELLRIYGRMLSVCCITCFLILKWFRFRYLDLRFGLAGVALVVFNSGVLIKNLGFNNVLGPVSKMLLFMLMVVAALNMKDGYIRKCGGSLSVLLSIKLAGRMFLIATAVQAVINPVPLFFSSGRFLGLTINPQVAGLYAGVTLIACTKSIIEGGKWHEVLNDILSCAGLAAIVILSGSRTALVSTVIGLAICVWGKIKLKLISALMGVGTLLYLGYYWLSRYVDNEAGLSIDELSRVVSTEDTRTQVYVSLWNVFLENLFGGASLAEGRMTEFGESSFLASGAALGLIGVMTISVFLACLIVLVFSRSQSGYYDEVRYLKAIIVVVLMASFTEALLLGSYTFFMLVLLSCYYRCKLIEERQV